MTDALKPEQKYNLSCKNANGKYWNYGSLQVTDKGYWRVSFKVTDQLRQMIDENGWINFSVFPDDRARPEKATNPSRAFNPRDGDRAREFQRPSNEYPADPRDDSDSIPF